MFTSAVNLEPTHCVAFYTVETNGTLKSTMPLYYDYENSLSLSQL